MPKRSPIAASALDARDMPHDELIELAFMGRSNCGKSSLINRLVGSKIAHTSSTPGRTQRINFFAMKGWYMVDLPGFGYAKVSMAQRARFGQAVETYLTTRQSLIGGILIQDVRRDPEDQEMMIKKWAYDRNLYLAVVASKVDKLNQAERRERKARLEEVYGGAVFLVSSRTGEGMDQVKNAIHGLGLPL